MFQDKFDQTIGRLDHILSLMIGWAEERHFLEDNAGDDTSSVEEEELRKMLCGANVQTLKHHAEDMVGAGTKILELLDPKEQNVAQAPEDPVMTCARELVAYYNPKGEILESSRAVEIREVAGIIRRILLERSAEQDEETGIPPRRKAVKPVKRPPHPVDDDEESDE